MKNIKKKRTILNVKPKGHDISYEYICPNCGLNHWLTNTEAKTNRFKIACECNCIIIPAKIIGIKLKYKKYSSKEKVSTSIPPVDSPKTDHEELIEPLKDSILKIVSDSLQEYGFEKTEAEELIKQAYIETKINDPVQLLKQVLQSLGANK